MKENRRHRDNPSSDDEQANLSDEVDETDLGALLENDTDGRREWKRKKKKDRQAEQSDDAEEHLERVNQQKQNKKRARKRRYLYVDEEIDHEAVRRRHKRRLSPDNWQEWDEAEWDDRD